MNNQSELGKAIISYDNIKIRLPGVFNPLVATSSTPTPPFINWVMAIFSELGRMNLWEDWQDGSGTSVKVAQLICPSNTLIDPVGGLSYVVNLGVCPENAIPSLPIDYSQRLFRNRAGWDASALKVEPDISLDAPKSTTRTVMLSENLQAGPWTYNNPPLVPLAGGYSRLLPLAFTWPAKLALPDINKEKIIDGPSDTPPVQGPDLSSYHRGNIIVTFCDGHVEQIPETTLCWGDAENPLYGVP